MTTDLLDWKQSLPTEFQRGALTIGNFDGVHRGHASLVSETITQAQSLHGPALALTFEPHPIQLLRPEEAPPRLSTLAQRLERIQALGMDNVLVLHTTPELLHLTADEFFHEVILKRLDAQVLIEGNNFGFGRHRAGNVDVLEKLCTEHHRKLLVVPPLQWQGQPVSSSRIRRALENGDVSSARAMFGHPYQIEGKVIVGEKRGRTLGFPTANLGGVELLIPSVGVYAVWARVGNEIWSAAANVGPNPTFGQQMHKIEVHLLDFQGDLYDKTMQVDFIQRLRDTRPFSGVEELLAQVNEDVERARLILNEEANHGNENG